MKGLACTDATNVKGAVVIQMEGDSFVLVRKTREYGQHDKNPKIRVKRNTYKTLIGWATATGKTISQVCEEAVAYAEKHLQFVDE